MYRRILCGLALLALPSEFLNTANGQVEYKRRWNTEPWAEQEQRALKNWLLDRLEDKRYWPNVELIRWKALCFT